MQDLTITAIQTDLKWEAPKENIDHFESKIEALDGRTDLIVLPEMFNTGFTMNVGQMAEQMDGDTIKWMTKIAAKKNCTITGSVIIRDEENVFNRMVWMRPDGSFEYYDKRHLFRMAGEDEFFSEGNNRVVVKLKEWDICLQVCYDLRFPVWSRNENDYDCLLYIANWPQKRINAWKILLQARAVENQCYVIGMNRNGEDGNKIIYSGDSAIIDPKGEILFDFGNAEMVHKEILSKESLVNFRKKFPVKLDADKFEIKL